MNDKRYKVWRNQGVEVIAPTYTATFLAVLEGYSTVRAIAQATGLGETTVSGHLKRLRGWGLIDWTNSRPGVTRKPITALYADVDCPVVEDPDAAMALATAAGFVEPSPAPALAAITDPMALRKGDLMAQDGIQAVVKEVRRGRRAKHTTVRLAHPETGHDWWVYVKDGEEVEGYRTAQGVARMVQAHGTVHVGPKMTLIQDAEVPDA